MVKDISILRLVGVSIFFIFLIFSCRTMPVAGVPHVSAYMQRLGANTHEIVIGNAVSVGPGWVAVFKDADGAPGEMMGYAPVSDGFNFDIRVQFADAPRPGWYDVQLFKDTGGKGKFEYPGEDAAVTGTDGKPVMDRFYLNDYNGSFTWLPP